MGVGKISAATFWTEQVRLTPLTSDPTDSEEGELWLRGDLADEDDQLATLRLDSGGSTVDIPVFDVGADVPDGIETQLRLVVDGQQGFVPTTADDPAIAQFGVWSGGVRYGAADGLSAIPDGEIHHWPFNEGSGSVLSDVVGGADGDINGPVWVSGDWEGGSALEGDGVDDFVSITTLGDFGSNMTSDFSVCLTLQTNENQFMRLVTFENSSDDTRLLLYSSTDGFRFSITDSTGEVIQVGIDTSYSDDTPHRVSFVKRGNAASDLEIWFDGVEGESSILNDEDFSTPSDFDKDGEFFQWDAQDQNLQGILDDIRIFPYSLSESEVVADYQRQAWF